MFHIYIYMRVYMITRSWCSPSAVLPSLWGEVFWNTVLLIWWHQTSKVQEMLYLLCEDLLAE